MTAPQSVGRQGKAHKRPKKPYPHAGITMQAVAPSANNHHSLNHVPDSTDEEPELAAAQPVNWEKTSPVNPFLAARAKLVTKSTSPLLDELERQPYSEWNEPVKPRASNRRQNAPYWYGLGVMISTVYPFVVMMRRSK